MGLGFDYSPGTSPSDASDVRSISELEKWMTDCIERYEEEVMEFESVEPRGRIYIARTIRYRSDSGLVQTGSAPCFFGGLWSLATCKKGMRGEPEGDDSPNPNHAFQRLFHEPDSDGVRRPKHPVFILPCSSRNQDLNDRRPDVDSHRNWLSSIAMVTHGFDRMEDYGRYLRQTHDGEAVDNRLTHAADRTPIAENRGDCHADRRGNVRYPPDAHQHGDRSSTSECGCGTLSNGHNPYDHVDNSGHHVKCVSEPGYWLGWSEPNFAIHPEKEFNVGNPKSKGLEQVLGRLEAVARPV
jgi:hypothetical protein